MSTTKKEQLQKTEYGTALKRAINKVKKKYLIAVHRTLTPNCLSNSVLELGPLPGNIAWSYTVTLAVIRLIYLSRYLETIRQVFQH
jgi:hypothetical protein